MADWSELPHEILHLISQRLDNRFDLVHFRSVCSSWRSSALSRLSHVTLRCPIPPHEYRLGDHCLVSRRCVYLLRSPPCDRPRYWLFKLGEDEKGGLFLQNLFMTDSLSHRYKKPRPSVSLDVLKFRVSALDCEYVARYSIWKDLWCETEIEETVGFMGLGARNDDFAVLGTISFKTTLALYRSVDKRWTVLNNASKYFEAVASFKGKFYVVDHTERTTVINPYSLQVSSFECSKPHAKLLKRGLVQSGDELLLLEMVRDDLQQISFRIFRLEEERNNWDGVEDLGDHVVFLCHRSSFSCLASELPGFKGNTIIFMDVWSSGSNLLDLIMVFDLSDQSLRSIKDVPKLLELFRPPPGWVISND